MRRHEKDPRPEAALAEALAVLSALYKQYRIQRAMLEGCGHYVVEGSVSQNAKAVLRKYECVEADAKEF